jgi:NADH-quinone oxidoreductase subunit I
MMDTTHKKQSLIGDFFSGFASFFKGMLVTATNLVARPKITLQYPYERPTVSPRYRGLFYLPYNEEKHRLNCTGCTLCEQACPTNVISMTKLGSGKHGGVSEFNMDLGRCMFCNLCIEACPFDAIYMGPEFELASTDRNASIFLITDLAQGGAASVKTNYETISTALAAEAAEKAAKAKPAEGNGAAEGHAVAKPKPAAPAVAVTPEPAPVAPVPASPTEVTP